MTSVEVKAKMASGGHGVHFRSKSVCKIFVCERSLRVNDKPTLSKMSIESKNLRCLPGTPSKRTQHFRPTVRNIVGCYTLRPFAHPVACCCVLLGGSYCAKFENGQTFQPATPTFSFFVP